MFARLYSSDSDILGQVWTKQPGIVRVMSVKVLNKTNWDSN